MLYFFLTVWAVAAVVMGAAWLRQKRTANAGIVDVLWTAGLGLAALWSTAEASGWRPRVIVVAVLAGLWSLRLTVHLGQRVLGEDEDGRYATLRRDLGEGFDRWMFVFFQVQALLVGLLALSFWVPMQLEAAAWRGWDVAGALLWVVSIGGEAIADRQLAAWRKSPENRGRTCRAGLWRYSRHPNYFFEWLHWLVYPLLAYGAPLAWVTWAVAALMLLLVLKVTGIPPTEKRALESRGDDYREYQRTTNAFFPGPPDLDVRHETAP